MLQRRILLQKGKSLVRRVLGTSYTYQLLQLVYFLSTTGSFRFIRRHPPGHFESPLPNLKDVSARPQELFGYRIKEGERSALAKEDVNECPDLTLREDAQLELLEQFSRYYKDLPFPETPSTALRYYYENDSFSYGDAIILYSILRYCNPSKIVEVGCGYSSAAMLDVNDLFLENEVHFTFIEPHPERLYSLLKRDDEPTIQTREVQDVPLDVFRVLSPNDILFIDSSHVVKSESDVAHILFNVLPELQPGVILHFHDIFWPFEYPKHWFYDGHAYNEAYFLRGFLQYNEVFEIMYFNSFIAKRHSQLLQEKMSLCLKNSGQSLWLRKVS